MNSLFILKEYFLSNVYKQTNHLKIANIVFVILKNA